MHFDIALKELFQSVGTSLTERLAGGVPVEWLNVELTETRAQRVDYVCRLDDGNIFHMEFQSQNDSSLAWRMLEYYVALFRKYDSSPRQVVLYMGNEPISTAENLYLESLQFRFSIVDLGNLDAEELWASPSIGDVILSILCRQPEPKVRLDYILRRIRALDHPEQRKRAARLLLIFSMKRNLAEIVEKEVAPMGATLEVEDDVMLQRIHQRGRGEGRDEGLVQGRNEGQARLLRIQLQQKFGSISASTEQLLTTATQQQLDRWGSQILSAASVEDVLK